MLFLFILFLNDSNICRSNICEYKYSKVFLVCQCIRQRPMKPLNLAENMTAVEMVCTHSYLCFISFWYHIYKKVMSFNLMKFFSYLSRIASLARCFSKPKKNLKIIRKKQPPCVEFVSCVWQLAVLKSYVVKL